MTYDDNGNATSYNPTPDRGFTFEYDIENQPITVTGGRDGTVTMRYRADGLRAWKESKFGRKYFLYDGDLVICEIENYGTWRVTWGYGYGPNGLSQKRDVINGSYEVYTFDPLGSYVQKRRSTLPTTTALDTAIYDSYGNLRWDQASSTGQLWPSPDQTGYLGQFGAYSDRETRPVDPTCLALVEQARYYDAMSGRHVTRGDEGFNPYAELSGIERVACYYFGALNALNPIEWGKGIYGVGKHLVQNRFSSQSFKDVLGGMLEGMKFWNKQDPFEQAQSFVGDALLALGAAKGISAAGAKLGGVKLYRAVKEAELADIKATGAFRNPYGIEKKYFSTTLEGAKEYARLAYGRWPHEGPYTIVRTRAPRGIIEWSGRIEKDIPTVVIPTKGLPQLGRPRISRRMPF